MQSFNIDDFRINTNYVIEASAGTGKTFNIVKIVSKLVNKYKIKLEEILIVTYTNKAVGELKDRIRKELKDQDVDTASIFTIHSFCENVIKEFGISSSLPLSLNIISDESLIDFSKRYVRTNPIFDEISKYIEISNDNNFDFDKLSTNLYKAINKYYLNKNFDEDETIISLLPIENNVIKIMKNIYEAKTFSDVLKCDKELENSYNIFKDSNEINALEFLKELENTYKNKFNFNGKKYKKTTKWCNSEKNDNLRKAFEIFLRYKEDIKNFKATTFFANLYLKDFYKKWQNEKQLNKNQTLSDMIRFVRENLLEDSSLLKALRQKYKYAIIDEFQDTNQLQFDIFKRIFIAKDHNIIVVGDPKQSIYSFEGADVNVYHNAKKEIKNNGGVICSLNKNYRSTANMVDSCNKLFINYDFKGNKFVNSDSLALNDKQNLVKFNQKDTNAFWIVDDTDEYSFAKAAVETIINCLKKDKNNHTYLQIKDKDDIGFKDVTFKDFAILVRTSSELAPIESYLKEAGIPFMRYKNSGLFSTKECADWITLLKAIDVIDFTGKNRQILKKALFTNFFGLSIKQTADKSYDCDDNEEISLIKKWRELNFNRKYEDLFDNIIIQSSLIDRLSSLSQMESLSIYKQISNFSIDYLLNGRSLDELIKHLINLSNGSNEDIKEDENKIERSTNFNCVQILTMHSSKGLQFPFVIAAGGYKNPKTDNINTYHDLNDKKILSFKSLDAIKNEKMEEFKRLFYVAYTRAKYILLLPIYNLSNGGKNRDSNEKIFLHETLKKYINQHKNEYIKIEYSGKNLKLYKNEVQNILNDEIILTSDKKEQQEENIRKVIEKVNNDIIYKHSYSSLSHVNIDKEDDFNIVGLDDYDKKAISIYLDLDKNEKLLSFSSSYPKGNYAGNALHEIFEHIDFKQNNIDHRLIDRLFKKQGIKLSDEDIKTTEVMIENVLHSKLISIKGNNYNKDDCFSLCDIDKKDKKHEIEFNFKALDDKLKNICNGFIDLLFKRGDCYCLLDWKSDSINDDFISYSDNQSLKKHVDEHYSIQRVLYSYCLIKWLSKKQNKDEKDIFNNHFGGIYYVFLKGCKSNKSNGIYCQTWNSYDDLKEAFDNIFYKHMVNR